jgi:hypothetical protein
MIGNQRAEVLALLDERDALLAALKAMVRGFEFDTMNAIAYAAACAAIAKAEGR